jgi:CubicO group peptidase (beta-lactamase class C family)
MKKALVLSLLVTLVSTSFSFAQQANAPSEAAFKASYDAYIRNVLQRIPDIPGVAVVVVKDDKPIFMNTYGYADRESGKKADTDTLFYIASLTKSFTALTAMLLDREGKIKIDDPITKYADGITFKNQIPEKVTIRNLLTHTSGLRNNPMVFRMAYSGESDPAAMPALVGLGTTYSDADYGKYAYDNLGYNIYGVLLQTHLKKRWQDELEKRIFKPMGMKHTVTSTSRASARKMTVAANYTLATETQTSVRSPLAKTDDNLQSAGGIFTSISDIAKWLEMNMNEGKLDGKQVFPAEIIRSMHAGYTKSTRNEPPFTAEEYGLGWQIGKYGSEKVIFHHGGFAGYRSHFSFLPERRIGVAVHINEDVAGGRMADVMATYAYDMLLGKENVDATYGKQLDDLVGEYSRLKQRLTASAAERAKRTSQLTLPVAAYTGRYVSELYGTMEITEENGTLAIKFGKNIKVRSTPFTEKDSIRVEMVPPQGEPIQFQKDASGQIESLRYRGQIFQRQKGS